MAAILSHFHVQNHQLNQLLNHVLSNYHKKHENILAYLLFLSTEMMQVIANLSTGRQRNGNSSYSKLGFDNLVMQGARTSPSMVLA